MVKGNCFKCGESGHWSRDCTNDDKRMANSECYKCGVLGHWASKCKASKAEQAHFRQKQFLEQQKAKQKLDEEERLRKEKRFAERMAARKEWERGAKEWVDKGGRSICGSGINSEFGAPSNKVPNLFSWGKGNCGGTRWVWCGSSMGDMPCGPCTKRETVEKYLNDGKPMSDKAFRSRLLGWAGVIRPLRVWSSWSPNMYNAVAFTISETLKGRPRTIRFTLDIHDINEIVGCDSKTKSSWQKLFNIEGQELEEVNAKWLMAVEKIASYFTYLDIQIDGELFREFPDGNMKPDFRAIFEGALPDNIPADA